MNHWKRSWTLTAVIALTLAAVPGAIVTTPEPGSPAPTSVQAPVGAYR